MGIQLPPELVEVAAKAGVKWPEADEDKMRTAATAWREAGNRITGLAGDSDGSATKTLTGLTGGTGDAARRHWNGVVAPDGDLNTSAKGCHAAADRLEHGAAQIGAAKVELVRELVNLSKNTDAAQSAAAAGHPTALLGLDTALAGASANVTNLTSTLTSSVRLDSGVDVGATAPPVNANPGSHHHGGGLLDTVTAPVTAAVPAVTGAVPAVTGALPVVPAVTGALPVVDTVTQHVVPAVTAPVAHAAPVLAPVVEAVPQVTQAITAPVAGGTDLPPLVQPQVVTAPPLAAPPIAVAPQIDIAPVQHVVDVPPAAVAQPLVSTTDGTVAQSAATFLDRPLLPTETFAPTQSPAQQAPAAPPTQAPTQAPSFGPSAPATPTAPVTSAPAAPAVGGAVVGAVQRTDQSPLQRLGDQSSTAKGTDQPGQRTSDQPGQRGSDQPGQRGTDQAAAQQRTDQKSTSAPQSSQQPAASTSAPTGKEAKKPDDAANADLFGVFFFRAFPRGSNPPPSTHPTRQVEPSAAEVDHGDGLRFPPQDHPHADLVVTAASQPSPAGQALGPDHPIVRTLTDGYDPQAGLHEREWDARFLRSAPPVPVWPPAGTFPEGGYEAGRPDVLPAGVELDRFGTPEGRVLSERGTPFAARSLPPSDLPAGYRRYVVSRPIPVWRTISVGWFGQPGGATRYRTTHPVADLVALGYLMELS